MIKKITLEDIVNMEKDFLTADDVSKVLGICSQSLRVQAREDSSKLGFPVIIIGHKTFFPREGFLDFCKNKIAS